MKADSISMNIMKTLPVQSASKCLGVTGLHVIKPCKRINVREVLIC